MNLVPLAPDLGRLQAGLDALAAVRETDLPGWTRRAFGDADREAREVVAAHMRGAGLRVTIDAALNVIGVLSGSDPSAPALVTGSHTDTVAGGGRFDGIIGVLGAIEAVRLLAESGQRLRHELRVVDFYGEEANAFGLSCIGSRALAGSLTSDILARRDDTGGTMAAALARCGGNPEDALRLGWAERDLAAYIELHIEQGPVLEARGRELGVVSAIAGIHRFVTTFRGRADHAGTTPMHMRQDAGVAAAAAVVGLQQVAAANPGGVATTGRVDLIPGASNVVPAEATVWSEMRSTDPSWLAERRGQIERLVEASASGHHARAEVRWLMQEHPTHLSEPARRVVTEAIDDLGLHPLVIESGAGHDAVQMALRTPSAMIFVPSHGGRSHCPEEWTDTAQIGTGVHALVAALIRLDQTM